MAVGDMEPVALPVPLPWFTSCGVLVACSAEMVSVALGEVEGCDCVALPLPLRSCEEEAVKEGVGETAALVVRVRLSVSEAVGETLRERERVKDREGEALCVVEVEGQGEAEGLELPAPPPPPSPAVPLTVGEAPVEVLTLPLTLALALGEPEAEGQGEDECVRVGRAVAEPHWETLRERLGEVEAVGLCGAVAVTEGERV